MAQAGANIEAFLKLDATDFRLGIKTASEAVTTLKQSMENIDKSMGASSKLVQNFAKALVEVGENSASIKSGLQSISNALTSLTPKLSLLTDLSKESNSFKTFASGLLNIAEAAQRMSVDAQRGGVGIQSLTEVMKIWEAGVSSAEVTVNLSANAVRKLASEQTGLTSSIESTNSVENIQENNLRKMQQEFNLMALAIQKSRYSFNDFRSSVEYAYKDLMNLQNAVQPLARVQEQSRLMKQEFERSRAELLKFAESGVTTFNKLGQHLLNASGEFARLKAEMGQVSESYRVLQLNADGESVAIERSSVALRQNSEEMLRNAEAKLRAMGYTGELDTVEKRLAVDTNQATSSIQRQSSAYNQASSSATRMTSATNGLKNALNSLKMVGTLVASMMVWNFASSLVNATRETVNAKSEMEGYFQMLHFSQGEIDSFNKALDDTVKQFQRVNKYSLGETISSIGVEFNLSTEEMKKAMKVTSMITSEYLRAGRNANEASLAVKDVLQGQFQRLSRETGVKGENLKDAGWSGDTTDVLGLMTALEKVGLSRNWDVFAEKANSLNDIVTILQNRFGEWSADMVNVVQPSIVNTFNAIMTVGQGLATTLGGMWEWLNGGSWGAIATQIGLISTALMVGVHSLTAYRTGATLTQVANMGLSKSITGLILGLKAEEMANTNVSKAIAMKVIGVNSEKVAEVGLTNAINQAVFTKGLYKTTTEAERLASQLKTGALVGEATAIKLVKDEETGAIILKEGLTIATTKTSASTVGFTGALGMMIAGEQLAEGETLSLAGSIGALTGAFLTSPIGWFTLAVLGLASAFYVLSGGLDDSWGKMERANKSIENASEATKPYRDLVNDTNKELEEAKQKYGENSLVVQELATKYDNAKASLDNYYSQLQSATQQSQLFNKELDEMGANLDATTRKNLISQGYSPKEADEVMSEIGDLAHAHDQYYSARQKLHKQQSDFDKDQEEYIKRIGNDKEALDDFNQTYQDLIYYSAKANTSDNWWDWMVNSALAGLSGSSLDFQKAMQGMWDDKNPSVYLIKELSKSFDGINKWFTDTSNAISNFDLGGLIDDNVTKPLVDSWTGLQDWVNGAVQNTQEWFNGIGESIMGGFTYIGDWLRGGWESLSTMWDEFWTGVGTWLDGAYANMDSFFSSITDHIREFIFNIDLSWISQWVTNAVTTFGTWLHNGIMGIPFVGDIISLFNTTDGANSTSQSKGEMLARAFGNALETIVGNIPILGDVLKVLSVILQAVPNANSKGQSVGDAIKSGLEAGIKSIPSIISSVFSDAIGAINKYIGNAYDVAMQFGSNVLKGFKDALHINSPSIISKEILPEEFGENIPNAILSGVDMAYSSAQTYGTAIKDGISSVNTNFSMDGVADEYQSDAQIISASSQMMGLDTTTAFNDMALAVNQSTTNMQGNVTTSYSTMQQKQATLLNNMKLSNTTAYNEMTTKSNESLLQMRDSTSNVTQQMVNAWDHMKTQLVATANALRSESTSHFNQLSNTIGSFYRKIQNPSNWGSAGSPMRSGSAPKPRVGRAVSKSMGFAGSPFGQNTTMSVGALKRKICPNGDCGNLFDGYSATDVIDVAPFLAMVSDGHGFGWGNWNNTHYNYIKSNSDQWDMKSPVIDLVGGIATNSSFKVGDFNNGQPRIGFDSFRGMAESIFSAIPYRFYYDSSWKGSWLGALQSGACNCWDGASALIAFANTCGLNGYMAHGTWTDADGSSYGHVWAVIEGHKMDTTGWQQRGTWTPSASAGSPNTGSSQPKRELHIHITGNNIYGVDEIEDIVMQGVKKGLREEFNDSLTVVI